MPRQRILILGGSGFLGRHVAARLAGSGHDVQATHSPGRTPPGLEGVAWLRSDLAATEITAGWPPACDTVVYLAQSRHWRSFAAGAPDVFRVNVGAVHQAAEYARRAGAARFLFASSGSVYTQTDRPAREDDRIDLDDPRSFYAASKLAAELLLQPYTAFLAVVILRLFTPYGRGQDESMLIPRLVRRVREGEPITLQSGEGLVINPVAAGDVAETLERCLELTASATLNVAGPEVLTLRAVGRCIGEVVGREPRFEPEPAAKTPFLVGDTTALEQRLGWRPATAFKDGLRTWLGGAAPDRNDPRS